MKLDKVPVLKIFFTLLIISVMLAVPCKAEELSSKKTTQSAVPEIDGPVMENAELFIIQMQKKMMAENMEKRIMQPQIQQAIQEKMQQSVKPKKQTEDKSQGSQKNKK